MPSADDSDRTQSYEVVLHHIEAQILDRSLHVGDQLPPERELAAQLGVGRSAVREAMRVLQTQGLITSSTGPGRGTRISPSQGDALGRIFSLHLTLAADRIADVTETRVALERASAALAAKDASEESLSELHALMVQMATAAEVESFGRLDTEFHVRIARATGNQLLADLTVAIREAARGPISAASLALPDWPSFRERLHDDHRQILAAISAGSPDRASALVESHIRRSYADLGITQQADGAPTETA